MKGTSGHGRQEVGASKATAGAPKLKHASEFATGLVKTETGALAPTPGIES